MELHKLPAGTVVFNAGDPAHQAYLIQKGTIELLRGRNGEFVRLTQLEPGEVFGEMSLIEERPHSLTARAVSAVELSGLTRDDFESVLTSDPATFRIYLKTLFERLRTLSAQIDATGVRPVAGAPSGLAVTIHPLTRRAAATLPHDGLPVDKYPFRIGRAAAEHEKIPLDTNDLWLVDEMPFNISRNHASLECEDGKVIVKDRGSSLGIHVNDVHIGGKARERQAELEDGDNVVVLGGRMSRYQFRIHVVRA
jgi:CRP/FNR family transcriptional regulator, cyclic AMP receptor protein